MLVENAAPPESVPPQVAVLGTPDAEFAPSADKRLSPMLRRLTILWASLAALFFFCAILFLVLREPFGKKSPPPAAMQILACACALVGGLFLPLAVWFGSGGTRLGPRRYLLYKDRLVEVAAGGRRDLRWDQIGPAKRTGALLPTYTFTVRDEADLVFDHSTPDHAVLAKTIATRAAENRLAAADGDANRRELASAGPAPFFVCRKPTWIGGQLYRVSVVGNGLLFLKVGEGFMSEKAMVTGGGALMAMAAAAPVRRYQQYLEKMRRAEGASERELVGLLAESLGSFVLGAAEVGSFSIERPSRFWKFMGSQHAATLVFTHARGAREALQLESLQDVTKAAAELHKMTGEAVPINFSP